MVRHESAPMHARHVAGGRFDGQRVERPVVIGHLGGATAEQPQASLSIEVTGITRAMPDAAAGVNLRLLVARAVEIAA